MRTIRKFSLGISSISYITMPEHSKILCVQLENNIPQLWAIVNTIFPTISRIIGVYMAEGPIPFIEGQYISTIERYGYSWHFFDLGEVNE